MGSDGFFCSVTMFFLLAIALLTPNGGNAQECLQPAADIPFEDRGPRLPSGENMGVQAIITSYQFHCCGNVTAWQTYVEGRGGHDGAYDITFQVWRPSPTVNTDGCYGLVGENEFTSISSPNYNDGLVSVTPEPTNIITAQPGDAVGYYVVSTKGNNDGIRLNDRFNGESVWYRRNTNYDTLMSRGEASICPFPVGSQSGRILRSSTNAAPMLSVGIFNFPCPSSPMPMPSSPSPPPIQRTSSPPLPSPTPTPTINNLTVTTQSTMEEPITSNNQRTTTQGEDTDSRTTTAAGEDPVGRDTNTVTTIVGVVVTLVLLGLISLVVIIIVLVLLKRRMVSKNMDQARVRDLANPSYELSSGLFSRKKKSSSHTANGKAPKPPPLPINTAPEAAMYETLDVEDPLDYTYPKPSPVAKQSPNSGSNSYSYIPATKREETWTNGKEGGHQYHVLGPDTKKNGSGRDKYMPPPPIPAAKTSNDAGLYHVLEGAMEDLYSQYEDPTLPKFRESVKDRSLFESYGMYVPTEEQRQVLGSNYEQQDNANTYNRLQFFVEDQIYWAPATTESGLYTQLASKKYREILRNQIQILEKLGAGQFGEVCKALWTVDNHTLELAVKTLKPNASEDDKVKFLQEAAIMGQFSHPNVIKLYGVVTMGEPVMLCLELLANGDLRSYLQHMNLRGSSHKDFIETQILFLKFARDIATGMDYLSQKSFVHRDLAARNVLLDQSLVSKIGDFGMARDLMDDTYYKSSGGKIPVKWTAPEALLYKKYSADSDVWSYGMVLFEIWSVAKKPFSTITNNQVLKLIQTGFCQAPPPGCPRSIYELMVDCWNPDHQERPSFKEICTRYLQQSSARVLYWSSADDSLSPSVGVLGAPLQEAFELHRDLQEKYKKS